MDGRRRGGSVSGMDANEVAASPSRRKRKRAALAGVAAALVVLLGAADAQTQAAAPAPPGSPGGEPLRVGGDVTRPVKISGEPPVYTEVARRARATGVVIVEVVIDAAGNVSSPRVLKPLPFGLDAAAIKAVQTWKFTPAMFRGQPVAVYFVLTVNFQLASDFEFGPLYSDFMSNHPDVQALADERKYGEAGQLIDGFLAQVGDNSLLFGRAYMHLGENDVEKAWRVAQEVTGPEQAELVQSIAAKAASLLQADAKAPAEDRAKTAEVGTAASALAVKLTTGGNADRAASALRTRAQLLRLQAETVSDPAAREKLIDEAKALVARADALDPAGRIYP
jgi:TonB family protein